MTTPPPGTFGLTGDPATHEVKTGDVVIMPIPPSPIDKKSWSGVSTNWNKQMSSTGEIVTHQVSHRSL